MCKALVSTTRVRSRSAWKARITGASCLIASAAVAQHDRDQQVRGAVKGPWRWENPKDCVLRHSRKHLVRKRMEAHTVNVGRNIYRRSAQGGRMRKDAPKHRAKAAICSINGLE